MISLNRSETDGASLQNSWWPVISFCEYQASFQHWHFQREKLLRWHKLIMGARRQSISSSKLMAENDRMRESGTHTHNTHIHTHTHTEIIGKRSGRKDDVQSFATTSYFQRQICQWEFLHCRCIQWRWRNFKRKHIPTHLALFIFTLLLTLWQNYFSWAQTRIHIQNILRALCEKHTENESRPNLKHHINPFHATLTTTYVKHTCKMYSWKAVEECEETAKRG